MKKFNDLQTILLSTAAQRDGGSLFPLAESAASAGARLTRAIDALLKAGCAEQRETSDAASVYRKVGDERLGLFITPAGCAAIGVGEGCTAGQEAAVTAESAVRPSKAAAVLALLQRDSGATLPELITATGWLPHTTRAALTGLRKKGHAIERTKREGVTCYRITPAAA